MTINARAARSAAAYAALLAYQYLSIAVAVVYVAGDNGAVWLLVLLIGVVYSAVVTHMVQHVYASRCRDFVIQDAVERWHQAWDARHHYVKEI
jgi:hypothetical protein